VGDPGRDDRGPGQGNREFLTKAFVGTEDGRLVVLEERPLLQGVVNAAISWTARVRQVRIGHEVAPLVGTEPGKVARIG